MITALLIIIALIGAFALVTWIIRSLLRYSCPHCGPDRSALIPIFPGVRWYCLGCETMLSTAELKDKNQEIDNS